MTPNILKIKGVGKYYPIKKSWWWGKKQIIVAVDGVDLDLVKGQTLGLVGESGSGKSTLAKIICRLEESSRGEVILKGIQLNYLQDSSLRKFRRHFQPIFQDPYGSLNPRKTVYETLREPLFLHGQPHQPEQVIQLLQLTGLGDELLYRLPHQLSGGQRQRLGLARALAVNPELLVADEPISSLDVSIQAQIINLLLDLQKKLRLSMVFISHDLRIVSILADHIAVMYGGRIMERAPARTLFNHPCHPYTRALLEAIPKLSHGRGRVRSILKGEVLSAVNPSPGCRFYSRCSYRQEKCLDYDNQLFKTAPQQWVGCCRWKEISLVRVREKSKIDDTNLVLAKD